MRKNEFELEKKKKRLQREKERKKRESELLVDIFLRINLIKSTIDNSSAR